MLSFPEADHALLGQVKAQTAIETSVGRKQIRVMVVMSNRFGH
jgi:hypothetical protein